MFTSRIKRPVRMIAAATAVGLLLTGVSLTMGQANAAPAVPDRPEGPCDIYEANDLPCWSVHSTTRALKATWDGPLYQVRRMSDGKVKDIPVVQPSPGDAGGYADSAVQDAFCLDTYCEIERVYDQSGYENDLYGNPRGGLGGYQIGGNDAFLQADRAPVSLNGHKVYGMFVTHGSGLRNDDPVNVVFDDDPESWYWVIDGRHYGTGCCFGYGNGEPDSRDNGNGTMEAMAFGTSRGWHVGAGPGPWAQTDQENNLIGCVGGYGWSAPPGFPDGYTTPYGLGLSGYSTSFCGYMPPVTWRWFAGFGDFGSRGDVFDGVTYPDGYWANRGANLETDYFMTYWEGRRLNNSYNPMTKQGAIYYGTGGDNSISTWGTMYEGAGAHFKSTEAIDKIILANIKAAKYGEAPAVFEPVGQEGISGNLLTFAPGVSQQATLSWTNMTGERTAVVLSVASNGAYGVSPAAKTFLTGVAPGETVSQVFTITGGAVENNADLVGTVDFLKVAVEDADTQTDLALMHARNTAAIKINEFAIQNTGNTTDAYYELYNAGSTTVDISGWTMSIKPHWDYTYDSIVIPANTTIAAGGTYVLGMSTTGSAAPINVGDTNVSVRSVTGLAAGQTVQIGTGDNAETAVIASVGTAMTTLATANIHGGYVVFMPLPPDCDPKNCSAPEQKNRPDTKYPAGTYNLPFTNATGFAAGQKVRVGLGDTMEVLTIAAGGVGVVGAQRYLSPSNGQTFNTTAINVAGSTRLRANNFTGITAGTVLRLDIDDRKEYVTVVSVGTTGATGTGLTLAEPLKYTHSNNMPFAVMGTGLTFTTPTQYDHWSSEGLRPLGSGVTFTTPLTKAHPENEVMQVISATVASAGFSGTPDQWFGGPMLTGSVTLGAAIALKTDKGNVVDSINMAFEETPWLSEGFQRMARFGPCVAGTPPAGVAMQRYPDGFDTDSNCKDMVGGPRTPGTASTVTVPTGTVVSLQFAKDPTQYVIHRDRELEWGTVSSDFDKMNASWIAMPALNGQDGCVSFMAYNQPNMFINTNDNVNRLWMTDGSSGFFTASSFCPVATVGATSPTVDILTGPTSDIRLRTAGNNATRYFRALYNLYDEYGLYQAVGDVPSSNFKPTPGDTPMNWAQDIVWNVVEGMALDVDKAALQALVDYAGTLNPTWFINWAWQMTAPLANAHAVLDTYGGPAVSVIHAAYDQLQAALDGLTPTMAQVFLSNPILTGDPRVGHDLVVAAPVGFPADMVYTYQWWKGDACNTGVAVAGTVIAGETTNTYTVQAADAGELVCARVTGALPIPGIMDPMSKLTSAMEIQVPIQVQKADLPATANVGQTITVDLAYTPTDSTYTVEWYRDGTTLIAGANSLTYIVDQADSGGTLTAVITVSKPGYDDVVAYSTVVNVGGEKPPQGTVVLSPAGPVAPGTPVELTWTVTPNDAFVIAEWYVGGNVVMMSTNPFDGTTYTPTAADSGKVIVVKLTVYVPSFSPLVLFSNSVNVS